MRNLITIVESFVHDNLEEIRNYLRREHWYRYVHIQGVREQWKLQDDDVAYSIGIIILKLTGENLDTALFRSFIDHRFVEFCFCYNARNRTNYQ